MRMTDFEPRNNISCREWTCKMIMKRIVNHNEAIHHCRFTNAMKNNDPLPPTEGIHTVFL